ncbi:hypothetical protein SNEBB_010674 [Seison nebaliae]|nr:hypothetical protein SNEBB_010674 [Seison nebaliae]
MKKIKYKKCLKVEKENGNTLNLSNVIGCSITYLHGSNNHYAYIAGATVVVYDLKRNRNRYFISKLSKAICCTAISPNEKLLAASHSGRPSHIIVWSMNDQKITSEMFNENIFGINRLIFDSSSKYLISLSNVNNRSVRLWDIKRREILSSCNILWNVNDIDINSNNQYFIAVGIGQVRYWKLNFNNKNLICSGSSINMHHYRMKNFIGIACGKGLQNENSYVISSCGKVFKIDKTFQLACVIQLRSKHAFSIQTNDDYVVVGGDEGEIYLLNIIDLDYIRSIFKPSTMTLPVHMDSMSGGNSLSKIFSSNQSMMFDGRMNESILRMKINSQMMTLNKLINKDRKRSMFTVKASVVGLVIHEEMSTLTCIYNDNSIYSWNISSQTPFCVGERLFHSNGIWGMESIDNNNRSLIVECLNDQCQHLISCSDDLTIRLWHQDGINHKMNNFKENNYNHLSPYTQTTTTTTTNNSIMSLSLDSYQSNRLIINPPSEPSENHHHQKQQQQSNRDSPIKLLTSICIDTTQLMTQQISSSQQINGIRCLKFSSRLRHLAVGYLNGMIGIFCIDTFEQKFLLEDVHEQEVLSIDYSDVIHQNTLLFVSSSRDRQIHISNAMKQYQLIQSITDYSSPTNILQFFSLNQLIDISLLSNNNNNNNNNNVNNIENLFRNRTRSSSREMSTKILSTTESSSSIPKSCNNFVHQSNFLICCGWGKSLNIRQMKIDENENISFEVYRNIIEKYSMNTFCTDQITNHIYIGSQDGFLRIYDIVSGRQIKSFRITSTDGDVMQRIVVNHMATIIAVATSNKIIKLFDLNSSKFISQIHGHSQRITSLKFVHERNKLISSSLDGTIFCWNLPTNFQNNSKNFSTNSLAKSISISNGLSNKSLTDSIYESMSEINETIVGGENIPDIITTTNLHQNQIERQKKPLFTSTKKSFNQTSSLLPMKSSTLSDNETHRQKGSREWAISPKHNYWNELHSPSKKQDVDVIQLATQLRDHLSVKKIDDKEIKYHLNIILQEIKTQLNI